MACALRRGVGSAKLALWFPRISVWVTRTDLKVDFPDGQAVRKLVEFKLLLVKIFAVELAES